MSTVQTASARAVMQLTPATSTVVPLPVLSYAQQKNAKYTNSKGLIVTAQQRWADAFNALPADTQKIFKNNLRSALARFHLNYPLVTNWSHLQLAEAVPVKLVDIQIDSTMQRELDIGWVINLLSKFKATKVIPIQVYRDPNDKTKYIAWDGQHTLLLLWNIAAHLGADFKSIKIPVNIYQSSQKRSIRECLLDLNGDEGKKVFEPIDHWVQRVYGVRNDGVSLAETQKSWKDTEEKQQHLESNNLFVTATKFGDEFHAGAITNVQELDRLPVTGVKYLARYLNKVCKGNRPTVGTELEIMSHYFAQCLRGGIVLSDQYVDDLAAANLAMFGADFSKNGLFWSKARDAYLNWHAASNQMSEPRFSKHKTHGFPFLIAQLGKSFGHRVPQNDSSSSFYPDHADLF